MEGWRIEAERLERDMPHLWPSFLALVHEARDRGIGRSSARQIMDILRWHNGVGMPNECGPVLGRMLIDRHPDLAGFLDVRPSRLDAPGDDRQSDIFACL